MATRKMSDTLLKMATNRAETAERKLAAAKAVVEFVRRNHNTRSDKLMELITEFDNAK